MTKQLLIGLVTVTAILQMGCATPGTSTLNTTAPEVYEVTNELTIDDVFDSVWDRLVGELSKSFYVINNIDKASRLINVSFASDTPEVYVDCGMARRQYKRGTELQVYDYEIASSSSYKMADRSGQYPVTRFIERHTRLEGRVNIYVAPVDAGTRVSVNAKYILSVTASGRYVVENLLGAPTAQGEQAPHTTTIDFGTNRPSNTNWGTGENPSFVKCYSRGKLEEDILACARPAAK
jgi:hypothetical protein